MTSRRSRPLRPLTDVRPRNSRWDSIEDRVALWRQDAFRYADPDVIGFMEQHFHAFIAPERIVDLARRHGQFFRPFFLEDIRGRLVRHIHENQLQIDDLWKVVTEVWGYSTERRAAGLCYAFVREYTFLASVLAALGESELLNILLRAEHEWSSPVDCEICGNVFVRNELPDHAYYGSCECLTCCFTCPILESPLKRDLMKLIPEFVEQCNFPSSVAPDPVDRNFTSGIERERLLDVFRSYGRIGGQLHILRKFGSWINALLYTGSHGGEGVPTARGIRCIAKDKHLCRSVEERTIDDWLTDHDINHETEPPYPAHLIFNPHGSRRADWRVGDVFIEYFGLVGDSEYDDKVAQKIALCSELGIPLIDLYPIDLRDLGARLSHLV